MIRAPPSKIACNSGASRGQGAPDAVYGGGTSASTPLWAALIARVNALLPRRQRRRYLTRLLYQEVSHGGPLGQLVCHDVTVGNNTTRPRPNKGFRASNGFDAVSGWEMPIGAALLLGLT
jgi:kumamolisin